MTAHNNTTLKPTECRYIFPYNETYIKILVYLFIITITLGVIFNIFHITVVILKKTMRNSMHIYTTSMAIGDIIYLILVAPLNVLEIDHYECWKYGETLGKIYFAMFYINGTASILTLAALTMDKHYCVVKPIQWRMNSQRYAKVAIVLIWIFSVVCSIPRFIFTEIKTVAAGVSYVVEVTEKTRYFWIFSAIYCPIVLLLIVVLNIRIVNVVYLRKNKLPGIAQSAQQARNATHKRVLKTIIYLLLIFLICSCPGYIMYITKSLGTTLKFSQFSKSMMMFGQYMFAIQAMINPLVYTTVVVEYGTKLMRIFALIVNRRKSMINTRNSTATGSIEMTTLIHCMNSV